MGEKIFKLVLKLSNLLELLHVWIWTSTPSYFMHYAKYFRHCSKRIRASVRRGRKGERRENTNECSGNYELIFNVRYLHDDVVFSKWKNFLLKWQIDTYSKHDFVQQILNSTEKRRIFFLSSLCNLYFTLLYTVYWGRFQFRKYASQLRPTAGSRSTSKKLFTFRKYRISGNYQRRNE